MKTFKYLFKFLKQYWKDTIWTWAFVLIESVAEVLIVYFMQDLLESIQKYDPSTGMKPIAVWAAVISGIALVAIATGIIAGYFASSAAAGFGKNLRRAMFEKIQKYSFKNIDKFSTPSIVTRTTTDVTNVQNAFQMTVRTVLRAPSIMIFSLIMAFRTSSKLAWVFVAIVPFCFAALILIATWAHPIFEKVFMKYDDLNKVVLEDVDGIRVVKSFDREPEENAKFKKVSDFIYSHFTKAERRVALNGPALNFAVFTSIILLSLLGANIIVSSGGTDLDIPGYSTLITYVMMIMTSLMMVSMIYVMIIIARNSANRIVEIIVEEPDIVSPENAIMEIPNGSVQFENVNFAYHADKYVLKHIDLNFKSGETIGILGSTGSGKTTLISLIARLYDVTEGAVRVGGHDVKEYDIKALRNSVAVVLQKNVLFSGTIRENLLWGNESATDEEIKAACDAAQVTPFLERLPDGINTKLDQGGTNVSGGQKQRICIARALLKNPKILLLDDSTSACDTATDASIRAALASNRKDVTKFIIAQRVLSVKDCDTIIVMNEGEVVAQGTSEELLNSCVVYKELYYSQLGGGDFDARS
ncbi:MAG: ABC transporter ATP-binding protein/permease [Bacilli bacterium]|nr:ABC transporter ATP-binding protein/permease [Bacilli bacterium]